MWRYLVAFLVILGLSLCALAAWGRSAENCSFDSPPGQALCERFVTRDLNTLDSPEANATTYYDNTAATAVTCTDATEAKGIVDFDPAPGAQTWGICYGTTRLDFANILTSETQSVFKTIDTSSGTDPVADITTDTLILTGTAPIVVTGDATEDSVTISCSAASGSNAGCLSSTDWTAFNGKDGSTTNEINTITADDTNTTSGLAITAAGGAGILTSVATNTLTIATASTEANFLTNGTSPPACSGNGALYQHTNGALGTKLLLCMDGAYVGIDNPFSTKIDGGEIADNFAPAGSVTIDLATYSAGLRLPVTASNPSDSGRIVVDSTTGMLEWYDGSALRTLGDLKGTAPTLTFTDTTTSAVDWTVTVDADKMVVAPNGTSAWELRDASADPIVTMKTVISNTDQQIQAWAGGQTFTGNAVSAQALLGTASTDTFNNNITTTGYVSLLSLAGTWTGNSTIPIIEAITFVPTLANGGGTVPSYRVIRNQTTGTTSADKTVGSAYVLYDVPTYASTGGTLTVSDHSTVYSKPTYNQTSTGTAAYAVQSLAAVGASGTLTTRYGFAYAETTGAGTLTNQIAVDIAALTKAGTLNIGIRNASTTVWKPPSNQTIAAGNTINSNATLIGITAASAVTTSTTTPIVAGIADGQILRIVNNGATYAVTIACDDGSSSNCRAPASLRGFDTNRDCVVASYGYADFLWNSTASDWIGVYCGA